MLRDPDCLSLAYCSPLHRPPLPLGTALTQPALSPAWGFTQLLAGSNLCLGGIYVLPLIPKATGIWGFLYPVQCIPLRGCFEFTIHRLRISRHDYICLDKCEHHLNSPLNDTMKGQGRGDVAGIPGKGERLLSFIGPAAWVVQM